MEVIFKNEMKMKMKNERDVQLSEIKIFDKDISIVKTNNLKFSRFNYIGFQ